MKEKNINSSQTPSKTNKDTPRPQHQVEVVYAYCPSYFGVATVDAPKKELRASSEFSCKII